MQLPFSGGQPAAGSAPELRFPWPCMADGRRLFLLASAPGGRGQSLGRFLGAAFLAMGLLLLLIGTQKGLPPALAGGGACILSGFALLGAVRTGRAPLLVLDGERGEAALCRRRFGRRAFRLFPLDALEMVPASDGKAVLIRPRETSGPGREIPALSSHIPDGQWLQGMRLPTPDADAVEAASALGQWQRLAREGRPPLVADACDSAEFAALLGKRLPPALLRTLSDADTGFSGPPEAAERGTDEDENGGRRRPLRTPTASRPEIRRAPDLRDATSGRDKRG